MSPESSSHEEQARVQMNRRDIRCAVLTVSDTRTEETDTGGQTIVERLQESDYTVHAREIVRDEPVIIRKKLLAWLGDGEIHVILTTGGTGIAKRDTTIEVVRSILTTELSGFGELFRMLSWQEVGAAAMLSRAVGGLVSHDEGRDTFIFSMPGSLNAVETAMKKLILPQLAHLVWERRK